MAKFQVDMLWPVLQAVLFSFPTPGCPASPRLHLLVVIYPSCAVLTCLHLCSLKTHMLIWNTGFSNPVDNLSEVLGRQSSQTSNILLFIFTDVYMGGKVLLTVVPFISLQTVSINVKNSSMTHVWAVTGKCMYSINFCMCVAPVNWVWNKCHIMRVHSSEMLLQQRLLFHLKESAA